jgi:hypothetical protein
LQLDRPPSADHAVRLVRAELGAYNWVLLTPGASGDATLLDAGNGSVDQMALSLGDDQVHVLRRVRVCTSALESVARARIGMGAHEHAWL